MIKTEQLVEFIYGIDTGDNPRRPEDAEKIQIIVHRLKYLDQLKEEVSNTYAGITASELFERNDLSG